jgi:electron transport complex protein RnfC
MRLWQFHGGVHLDGHKELSNQTPIAQANIPKILILPLLQHIGEPTEPIVHVGEKVLKGQIIAHCFGSDCRLMISAPIHASSSGTVVAIEPRPVPHPSGLTALCMVIETDGLDTWTELEAIPDYATLSPAVVRESIAGAGIVGLGGAGFPSHIKLNSQDIDSLIINGAECEPYITCDDRLMREYPAQIIEGAQIIRHILGGTRRCLIGVEDNKPEAYQALSQAAQGRVEIIKIPTRYPTGDARQLIRILTGKEVGRGRRTANTGILVHNIETTRAVYRAVMEGRPLISRVVTVTGSGIAQPQNLEILLGTPMSEVIDQCGRKPDITRLIMGGGLMGDMLSRDELPVIKTTNCLIADCASEISTLPPPMPCIRCGACADVCPINLLPQQLYWHAKAKDFKKALAHHLFDCIDCGCCAYVCPSHIPLVSYYRYAKAEIRATERERKMADKAKRRHEFRLVRLEREKVERLVRLKQKVMPSDHSITAQEAKKAEIEAAIQRAKAKKAEV